MSGHSRWSRIKRKKGAADARRGKIFSKIIREIMTAARTGGADLSGNSRLRLAIESAKAENMPKENIDRAIKKGTGEIAGVSYVEVSYEGYGPCGVAVLVQSLTDNKNRTVGEIRRIFMKNGGNLGETGCVGWMFNKKGYLTFDSKAVVEDRVMEVAIEAGAEDVRVGEGEVEIVTEPKDLEKVKAAFEEAGIASIVAEVSMLPQTSVSLKGGEAAQMLDLMESLEEQDDVQKVYANFDIPQSTMEEIGSE